MPREMKMRGSVGVGLIGVLLLIGAGSVAAAAGRAPGTGKAPSGGGFDWGDAGPKRPTHPQYDALFGAEEKKVESTPATKDDAAFAALLMDKSKALADAPLLLNVIYQRAFEFGIKDPDGYATAIAAAKALREQSPEETKQWRPRLITVRTLQLKRAAPRERAEIGKELLSEISDEADELLAEQNYAEALKHLKEAAGIASTIRSPRADELSNRVKETQLHALARDRLLKQRADLARNPTDTTLRDAIIRGFVTELDDPKEAMTEAASHPDPGLRAAVALAAKDPKDLTEPELVQLGQWYQQLAETAPAGGKITALRRSQDYYQAFLDLHEKKDVDRLKVAAATDAVTDKLNALAQATVVEEIVLWNQHNGADNDRGTMLVNVILFKSGKQVWRKDEMETPWQPARDMPLKLPVPHVPADRLRVEILKFRNQGGGLAEIEVFSGRRNVAAGAPVAVSAVLDNRFGASALVDGATTSAEKSGYWLLPTRMQGWAEIDLRPKARAGRTN